LAWGWFVHYKKTRSKRFERVDIMKDVLDDDEVEIRKRWGRLFERRGGLIDVEKDAIGR